MAQMIHVQVFNYELFGVFSAANPFGGGSNTSLTSQSTPGMGGAPNPMGANPFGATQQGGFGQFGAPAGAPVSNPGFGQFGSATSTQGQGGFGQFGMQNGGFGGMPSTAGYGGAQTNTATGFGGQGFGGQQAGFTQQQPGFGAPAAFGGQPAGGFGGQPQQMQGFGVPAGGGWGQPGAGSTVNPFMVSSCVKHYAIVICNRCPGSTDLWVGWDGGQG